MAKDPIGYATEFDIPLFEKSAVDRPVFPWPLDGGGTGYFHMVSISEADKPRMTCWHPIDGHLGSANQIGPDSYVIDDFEMGYLRSAWEDVATAAVRRVAKQYALGGQYGLRIHDGLIQANSGLNYFPKHGDEFRFRFVPHSLGDYANVYWLFNGINECYQVQNSFGSDWFRVWRTTPANGTTYLIAKDFRTTPYTWELYHEYEVTIDHGYSDSGTIYATLRDLTEGVTLLDHVAASDPGPTSGMANARNVRLAIDNESTVDYDEWIATKVGGT